MDRFVTGGSRGRDSRRQVTGGCGLFSQPPKDTSERQAAPTYCCGGLGIGAGSQGGMRLIRWQIPFKGI
jgi:hypothetical protein